MRFAEEKYCTAEEFYNIPDDIRAELINGEIVYMASPSRIHQEILGELFNIIKNPLIYLTILIILQFIQFTIRAYLEIDAMIKAKYLAKEYMKEKKIISKEEINLICKEFDKMNEMGIPFYVWNLFSTNMIKIIIYAVIAII